VTAIAFWTNDNRIATVVPGSDLTAPYKAKVTGVAAGSVTLSVQGIPLSQVTCRKDIPVTVTSVPACSTVKAYDTDWNLLDGNQLANLARGTKIRFTIAGTPVGEIDKAKFIINGDETEEITKQKPNTNEYWYEYTIPATGSTFNVTAKLHHVSLGWF
jgi:hypothetical protein